MSPNAQTLVYMAGPYSHYEDKEALMTNFMTVAGNYMIDNPGAHVVSPLFMHYSLAHCPTMGSDYNFFGDYSRNLLRRCDKVVVVMFPQWEISVGVMDEMETAKKCGIPIEMVDPSKFIR